MYEKSVSCRFSYVAILTKYYCTYVMIVHFHLYPIFVTCTEGSEQMIIVEGHMQDIYTDDTEENEQMIIVEGHMQDTDDTLDDIQPLVNPNNTDTCRTCAGTFKAIHNWQ